MTCYSVTCFKICDSHLITYKSGNIATQIDFVLLRKSLRKLVMDVKVIPGEEVALQHQLLVCKMMIDIPPQIKCKLTPHPKVWKLRDPQTCSRFQEVFKAHTKVEETEAASTTTTVFYRTQYPASYMHKSLGRTRQFTLPTQMCLLCLSLKSQVPKLFRNDSGFPIFTGYL